jgi:type IV secretion system protein VirB9
MIRLAMLLALAGLAAPLWAQVSPTPAFDDPRLQTVAYDPARPVRLVAFPDASLTVVLLPDDPIERVVVSDPLAFDARPLEANDSLSLRALRENASATLLVDTQLRRYEFELATGSGLAAAYLVRFIGSGPATASLQQAPALPPPPMAPMPPVALTAQVPTDMVGEYRLSGERSLQPSKIGDDGTRTYLEWDAYQSLPAVFGIGFNGEEEVVDGYMRGGVFTIDRVYGELVFRVDKKRARARRLDKVGS